MRRDVFQAIADPTRRQIVSMLTHKPLNLNAVADAFEISRPAISKHVKILNECGIVTIEQRGRERFCRIQPESLKEVADWIAPFQQLWEQRLDSFETYLEQLKTVRNQ